MGISRWPFVTTSTVYYKRKTPGHDTLEAAVLEIFGYHNGNYGERRIKIVLNRLGQTISRRRIGKILKKHALESKHGRRKLARNLYTATDCQYIAENLIKGEGVTAPNQVCQMDSSQFKYNHGKLFVSGIIDVYDKTVIIKSGHRESKELIPETLEAKLRSGKPQKLHTDRGTANLSLSVKELLDTNGIQQSMSAPHKPNENQYIETFWKSAKTEIGDTKNLSLEQLKMVLDYYIHYYNTERIHSSIGYLTPEQMRFG